MSADVGISGQSWEGGGGGGASTEGSWVPRRKPGASRNLLKASGVVASAPRPSDVGRLVEEPFRPRPLSPRRREEEEGSGTCLSILLASALGLCSWEEGISSS